LVIPKLSVSVPIIFADSRAENQIQADLQNGAVHLKDTVMPGEIGNSYIVGHSSDYPDSKGNYKTVFAKLPTLVVGDEVVIRGQGRELHFKVIKTKIVEADDLSVLSQDTGGRAILTLQTSYPIGTAQKRFIVSAELIP
jgi:sortase A